jgi:hypothetical protein
MARSEPDKTGRAARHRRGQNATPMHEEHEAGHEQDSDRSLLAGAKLP